MAIACVMCNVYVWKAWMCGQCASKNVLFLSGKVFIIVKAKELIYTSHKCQGEKWGKWSREDQWQKSPSFFKVCIYIKQIEIPTATISNMSTYWVFKPRDTNNTNHDTTNDSSKTKENKLGGCVAFVVTAVNRSVPNSIWMGTRSCKTIFLHHSETKNDHY